MGRKTCFFRIGLAFLLVFSGCGVQDGTEALQSRITQLEQRVSEWEAKNLPASHGESGGAVSQNEAPEFSSSGEFSGDLSNVQSAVIPNDGPAGGGQPTGTMEELAALVSAFEEKVNASQPKGESAGSMELFFSLKQEEKQIDDCLDLYEDELEFQYRAGSLTASDYKAIERELEGLEDRLDAAEDRLEYIFGIDD